MKCKSRLSRPAGRVGDDCGVALPLALMAFVVLGALSAALLAVGSSEVQIASNHLRNTQAQFLAEAGIEHAFNALLTTPSLMTNANATLQNIVANSQLGGAGSAIGSYNVQYQAAGANTVRVISTGLSAIGSSQKIRRAIMSTSFISKDAILTNGSLSISGSTSVGDPIFQGQCGSVHTDANLALSGNPTISGAATASGTYTVTGTPGVGPGSGGGQPQKTIPAINPTNFLNAAKASLPANQIFQMKANGQVLDGNGALINTLSSGGSYNGWKYTSGTPAQWELHGNTGTNGTYYFEGNATLSGSPGSSSTPWVTTLIATGNMTISGSPVTQSSVTDTLFIAGLDMEIGGTPSANLNGLIAAHEQVKLDGNPTINGFLIAEDAGSTSDLVTADTVIGNPTIIYSCDLNPPLQGPLQILSWGL